MTQWLQRSKENQPLVILYSRLLEETENTYWIHNLGYFGEGFSFTWQRRKWIDFRSLRLPKFTWIEKRNCQGRLPDGLSVFDFSGISVWKNTSKASQFNLSSRQIAGIISDSWLLETYCNNFCPSMCQEVTNTLNSTWSNIVLPLLICPGHWNPTV